MGMVTEEQFCVYREQQSREMAAKASTENARNAHLELAKLYALRRSGLRAA